MRKKSYKQVSLKKANWSSIKEKKAAYNSLPYVETSDWRAARTVRREGKVTFPTPIENVVFVIDSRFPLSWE